MSEPGIDPQVVQLIEEVASDPRSSILRVPRERLLKWVGRPDEVLTPYAAHLTRAEKHLVASYREDAAHLLLLWCIEAAQKGPLPIVSAAKVDPGGLVEKTKRVSTTWTGDEEGSRLLGELADGGRPSVVHMAACALRLVPWDKYRNALAVGLIQEWRLLPALRMLDTILSRRPTPHFRALALINKALVSWCQGDLGTAIHFNDLACNAEPGQPQPFVSALSTRLQAGTLKGLFGKAAELERLASSGRDVDSVVFQVMRSRKAGGWKPSHVALFFIPRVREDLPPSARKVADAFL